MILSKQSMACRLMILCGLLAAPLDGTAAEPRFERSDAFTAGVDGYHSYRLPTLICTQRGTLLLFCDGRKNTAGDLGKIDPVLRRSVDGGKTWQAMEVLHSDPGEKTKVGNACALYDRQTDTVHLIYLHNLTRAYLRSSQDDGVGFAAPRDITAAFREFDFPGRISPPATCTASSSARADWWRRSGSTMCRASRRPRGQMRNGVIYSEDHGRTWHAGGLVASFHSLNESSVFEAADGALVLNCRAMRAGYRAVARSGDQGRTWTTPTLDEQLPDPTCQASTLVLPSRDGRSRVLFANPATQKTRSHLTVRLSYDDGRTWPIAKLVDTGGAAYSDMAVGPDGTIYLGLRANGEAVYDRVAVARLNLEWLTEGRDRLGVTAR